VHPTNDKPVEVLIMLALAPKVVDAVFQAVAGHLPPVSMNIRSAAIAPGRAIGSASSGSSSVS
jgi:hypothetical protein